MWGTVEGYQNLRRGLGMELNEDPRNYRAGSTTWTADVSFELDIAEKLESVSKIRAGAAGDWHDATPAEMTIPSTIGDEKRTNPFVRASDAEQLGRLRRLKDEF